MNRGEIWWADLPPPIGRRPVLLLSRNEAYRVRTNVTVAPVTRRVRGIPTEVALPRSEGLPRESVVNLDSITTIPKERLERRVAALAPAKLAQVEAAIHFALDLKL